MINEIISLNSWRNRFQKKHVVHSSEVIEEPDDINVNGPIVLNTKTHFIFQLNPRQFNFFVNKSNKQQSGHEIKFIK